MNCDSLTPGVVILTVTMPLAATYKKSVNDTPHNNEEKTVDNTEKQVKKPRKSRLVKNQKKPRMTNAFREGERLASEVISLWLAGKTVDEISDYTQVSRTAVVRIKNSCPPEILEYMKQRQTSRLSELIELNLEKNLEAMNKIVEVANDEVWLKAQRATELATFFGVISDKTVRVLAAIERANELRRMESRGHVDKYSKAQPDPAYVRE